MRLPSLDSRYPKQRAGDDARRQLDLEAVSSPVPRAVGREPGRGADRGLVDAPADERRLDAARPPGLGRDAPERDAHVADGASVRLELDADSGGGGRELVA